MRTRLPKGLISIIIGFCLLFTLVSSAGATSLFNTSNSDSMFSDYKARKVGDLVTVLIIEQAQARQSADSSAGSDNNYGIGPGGGALADLIPLLRFSYDNQFNASGGTSRGGSITAKLTTRVTDLYDNGTMRIEGKQTIVINEEEQEIIISGIVRSRDIDQENTVISSLVADSQIEFTGTGIIGDEQSPGIITRFFNWLF